MNPKIKHLLRKLGEAIHESVSESPNISGVVKDIREQGFEVMLMLEATIGLNHVDAAEAGKTSTEDIFTENDMNFLQSLRISLPEAEEAGEENEASDSHTDR